MTCKDIKGAGFGVQPSTDTTSTGSDLIDAFVWVKPPGNSHLLSVRKKDQTLNFPAKRRVTLSAASSQNTCPKQDRLIRFSLSEIHLGRLRPNCQSKHRKG